MASGKYCIEVERNKENWLLFNLKGFILRESILRKFCIFLSNSYSIELFYVWNQNDTSYYQWIFKQFFHPTNINLQLIQIRRLIFDVYFDAADKIPSVLETDEKWERRNKRKKLNLNGTRRFNSTRGNSHLRSSHHRLQPL